LRYEIDFDYFIKPSPPPQTCQPGQSGGDQWNPHSLSAKSIGTTTVAEYFDRCRERWADQAKAFSRVHVKLFLASVVGFFLDLGRRAGTKVGRQVTIDRVFAL
jgi:hypothetical protein